ncbi:MAG: deoxyguanosinetriphosphate triphosphohydrolase [Peptococcaceae bacterium]|nr:deoxyguanosinetriphosphate triphosphohydrolase [Peptococcaceae bacterium]
MMNPGTCIRQQTEQQEYAILSPYAAKSAEATRVRPEEGCPIRTSYQRDRDRVLHSKPFRRLKHKTQVYIAPAGDHYRTRMTHSLEVAQICRTVGRALRLNEDLIEAIALGHDVGHTPFGHVGEQALAEIVGSFEHNRQSLRTFTVLTADGQGLNLTEAVLDGILHHTGDGKPNTLEGQIVRVGDRIGYLCHDFDDAVRAGYMSLTDLPGQVRDILGETSREMITSMTTDMIQASWQKPAIAMSPPVYAAMGEFRQVMFDKIYNSGLLLRERFKGKMIIRELFKYCRDNPGVLPEGFLRWADGDVVLAVTDYLAGCTDNHAISLFQEIFIPRSEYKLLNV